MDGFVHLHVHSHYALLDGGNRISDLVGLAKEHGSGAIALTDHGNLFGAIDFYKTAKAEGVKPILGIEAYISPTDRFDKSMSQREASYHLLLLAMNKAGWQNLLKLSSKAYLEGFYYRPRIDRELLAEHAEGLICCSACIGGEIPQALLANQPDRARQIAGEYRDIFSPERFFIELQNHSTPDQHRANPMLVDLASKMGLPLVGTNDVHFLRAEDKKMHEIDDELYFSIDEKSNVIDLTEKGRETIAPDDPEMFVIPDLGTEISKLEEEEGYDPTDQTGAWEKSFEWGEQIPIGIFYRGEAKPTYEEQVPALQEGPPLVKRPVEKLSPAEIETLLAELA